MKVTARMVQRQLLLIGRSARDIAKTPGRARGLRRLLLTGGRSTMKLRLPWLPFTLIERLESRVGPQSMVFEYGGGGSTLWFLDRGASVVTVEHDPKWAEHLSRSITEAEWTLLDRSLEGDGGKYVDAIASFADETFDVVVVDGRERARCVLAAAPKVKKGGWMIVDDVDRAGYAPAIQELGWPRTDITGFAPAKPSLAYTAVLEKPQSA